MDYYFVIEVILITILRTLEYLETLGVPVLTYGSTSDFPAFYSAKSGFKVLT